MAKRNNFFNFWKKIRYCFDSMYQITLIILCFFSIISCIAFNIDISIIDVPILKSIIKILQDNSLTTLLLTLFIFEYIRREKNQKKENIMIVEKEDFDNIIIKEFMRSEDVCIILSSSRASFATVQHLIDKNINKNLNIKLLIKKPNDNNDRRKILVNNNIAKWFELKKDSVDIKIKMYSGNEVLRCYIFDNSRILAGIYSYKDTIKEKNSYNIECERHRFYGHSQMLYYEADNDSVGNFILDKYKNQFNFMWEYSEKFKADI